MNEPLFILTYVALIVFVVALHLYRRRRLEKAHAQLLQEAIEAGLTEPPSLHPVVDPVRCVGSKSCITACPEQALGFVNGKATLVNASACIGHGACAAACPLEAITLVFGTERRGIDIPQVKPNFESNVPGIFIAGELGGMGLIRKAAEQGKQAIDAIRARGNAGKDLDVVIVGAGPAGLSAALAAKQSELRYRIVEQENSLGGTIFHYPRNKIAMAATITLAIIGKVKMGEISKEKLLDFWNQVVDRSGIEIRFGERMEAIERRGDDDFVVRTNKGEYATRAVLLAIGRRGTPRKLGVPGEESPKVVYRLVDPEQYRGKSVLVVGGGDSALEAALALSEERGTDVTLSYRGEAFSRVKAKNREWLQRQQAARRVRVLMSSQIKAILPDHVVIDCEGEAKRYRNHAVIVCAGGELPIPLLQRIGITFETKHGTA
jgi:thioredoxin reductase/Pyruvate/2-oxoacid:ferredoxin oxidoreductase delta subunit